MPEIDGREPADRDGLRVITISSESSTREIRLTKGRLRAAAAVGALAVMWTVGASAGLVMSLVTSGGPERSADAMEAAYEARIAALTAERDQKSEEALSAQLRFSTAMERISDQQASLLHNVEALHELETGLDLMRGKLASALEERDSAAQRVTEMRAALDTLNADMDSGQAEEMTVVLAAVSDALQSAVRTRDSQAQDLSKLESQVASLELRMQINAERQENLVASLEDAVETSFVPLETMFRNAGLEVDSLLSNVRRNYSGVGGPLIPVSASATGFADPELNDRFASLMNDMDRMNMMRIAAAKVPLTMPVLQSHRFTSGFGTRRDPKTGGRRAHNGIDLAGPRGTPIHSTADGVIVFAGRQSGFGNLIRVRHEFGFETYYAHLNKIRVNVGDRVARGDHIGDMGTTGRSTGVHLHYEVRLGGKPVNPMTYIKAARNVF